MRLTDLHMDIIIVDTITHTEFLTLDH